jgi:hypothetical protein|tara:strand:+ start:1821 stop:2060 length:240 start_codon:yes stop_codon:yes gene_type:complete
MNESNVKSCIKYFEAKMHDELQREKRYAKQMNDLYKNSDQPKLTDYAKQLVDKSEINKKMKKEFGLHLTTEAERLLSKS